MFNYYTVRFSNPRVSTVAEYLNWEDSPAFNKVYKEDHEAFLNFKDNDGVSNREKIEARYLSLEDRELIGRPATELILKIGTDLCIPIDRLNAYGLLTQGIEVVRLDEPLFKAEQL